LSQFKEKAIVLINPNRFCLNYKNIPYRTEWLELEDIELHLKKLGIKPTGKKPDGRDLYTLPAIHDPSTGTYLADSFLIAQYLDKTYPDTPPILPSDSIGLQVAFEEQFMSALVPLWQFITVHSIGLLTPRGQEYGRRSKEMQFGKRLEDMEPKGEDAEREWEVLRNALGKIDGYYAKVEGSGPFILGPSISWGDIVVVSAMIWIRLSFGEESQRWKYISSWHGGRWGALLKAFNAFFTIV